MRDGNAAAAMEGWQHQRRDTVQLLLMPSCYMDHMPLPDQTTGDKNWCRQRFLPFLILREDPSKVHTSFMSQAQFKRSIFFTFSKLSSEFTCNKAKCLQRFFIANGTQEIICKETINKSMLTFRNEEKIESAEVIPSSIKTTFSRYKNFRMPVGKLHTSGLRTKFQMLYQQSQSIAFRTQDLPKT